MISELIELKRVSKNVCCEKCIEWNVFFVKVKAKDSSRTPAKKNEHVSKQAAKEVAELV